MIRPDGITNNAEARGRAKKRADQLAQYRVECWRKVLASAAGRVAMLDILQGYCHMRENPFVGGPNGDRATALRCGQQNVGYLLMQFFRQQFPQEAAQLRAEEDAAPRVPALQTEPDPEPQENEDA